jgi:PAS domain S-box-containing protein
MDEPPGHYAEGQPGTERANGPAAANDTPGTAEPPEALVRPVEVAPDPAFALADGVVVAANGHLGEAVGRDPDALVGRRVQALFPTLCPEEIEANCEAGPGAHVTTPVTPEGEAADGAEWLELSFGRQRFGDRQYTVATARDVTGRAKREPVVEQYERVFETIEDGVYVLDDSFRIETVNGAIERMTGYDRSALVGEHATILADESTIDEAVGLIEQLRSGEREVATLTTELATADGGSMPIETRFSTYRLPDGEAKHVGVVRDISDRKQFEETLAALHESTRKLLGAQTAEEACELVVDSTRDVLDAAGAAIYRFDRTENRLRPTVLDGVDAEQAPIDPGESPLWTAFIDGERVTVPPSAAPGDGDVGWLCLPLGAHGVLALAVDADRRSEDFMEVVELLAANAEAGLTRVAREESLRERDEELSQHNRQLRKLKEVNAVIRRIDRALVDADTRDGIEQAVCDGLTDSEWISMAWIGRTDETDLDPQAWAGEASGYLDAVSLSVDDAGERPPAVRTAQDGSVTVVSSVASGFRESSWRSKALSRDFQSALSVPLEYEGFSYGVLTVYGTEQFAIGGMIQSVFAELGETIARAICEVQSRRRRSAATAVELELRLSAPTSPLQQFAGRLGEPVVCEGIVPGEETTRLFFRTDADATVVGERCADMTRVRSLHTVGDDEGGLFEAVVSGETVGATLLERGARAETIEADARGRQLDATVSLPPGIEVRRFVEHLDGRYGSAQLTARREREFAERTAGGIGAEIESRLTDRQLQVLRTAYLSGFFDWPRKTTGQDLADKLNISQPTVSRHLRKSTRRILDIVLDA